MERKTITLGDDRFAVDSNGKIYRNGYGLTPVGPFLYYYENHERKKIARDALVLNLHSGEMDETEAVRRTKILTGHMLSSTAKRRRRTANGTAATVRKVYCVTRRKKFKSMTVAAEYYGVAVPTLSKALKNNTKVKGMKFRVIP